MKFLRAFLVWFLAMAGSAVAEEWKIEPLTLKHALALACRPVPENQKSFAKCQTSARMRNVNGVDWGNGYKYVTKDADAWRKLMEDKSASIYGRMIAAHFLAPTDEPAREFLFECATSAEPRYRMNAANVLVNLHYDIDEQADWIMPRLSAMALEGKFDLVEEPFSPTRTWPEEDQTDHRHDVYFRFSHRLTFWKDPRAVDVLIRCVEKGIAVDHAADSLGSLGDRRAVPSLQAWFQTRKSPPRRRDRSIEQAWVPGDHAGTDKAVVRRNRSSPAIDWFP